MVIPPVGPTCVVCFRICHSESLVYRLTLGIHRTRRESACWLVDCATALSTSAFLTHVPETLPPDSSASRVPPVLCAAARQAQQNGRQDASTLILQPGIPQGAPLGPLAAYPTTPTQASGAAAQAPAPLHAPVPIAAPAIPHAPVPIAIPHAPNPYVPNPYGSGSDPNAEALLSLMPHSQHITRNVRARRIPGQRNYLAITSPNTLDAAAFVQPGPSLSPLTDLPESESRSGTPPPPAPKSPTPPQPQGGPPRARARPPPDSPPSSSSSESDTPTVPFYVYNPTIMSGNNEKIASVTQSSPSHAPSVSEGRFTIDVLRVFETCAKRFFRAKKIAADDQVAQVIYSFEGHAVQDWISPIEAQLVALSFTEFMGKLRTKWLRDGWDYSEIYL
ncbi:hypothetical protein LshimejAT787_1900950 [Lyophyllum shimeji]|uniref:Uncharacterized protein n=1 Tax=Lyophyllum shimeji TaxID=47721 RepID=A0A9P3Q1D6_LYOSH|nr:hypothetical protein LshimejAT787_1900950 [Lyophyllum shimeji]